MGIDEDALDYHREDPAGKLEIATTKPTNTQYDLSLAYSPGVAAPCREIDTDPEQAFQYTAKGNLVAVVSDGSATLGIGDIGPVASKPVMEGKGVLFKRFADIDVFDLELDADGTDQLIETIEGVAPTFGGINLEDIAAPACFEIEQTLSERLDIPVFHDDQHGTAIISGAALLNAAEIADKELSELAVVFSGAGASAVATARFFESLGVRHDNIRMCDSGGIVTDDRVRHEDLNEYKAEFASDVPEGDLADAMAGADAFVGLSVGGIVDQSMVRSMASDPIIFAMANPDPEIGYEEAKAAREDTVIMATGRSDYPNQVNNVLGFPFIFRGALDVRAREINEEMKVAAANALAELARQDVPDEVVKAYGDEPLQFGPDYIIPKPLDPRVLFEVTPAVARAGMESGAARSTVDLDSYVERLEARLGKSREMMRVIHNKAQNEPMRVALAGGDDEKMIRAAYQLEERGIADPLLIGDRERIEATRETLGLSFDPEVVDPAEADIEQYADRLYELRHRKGVTEREARDLVRDGNYFASVMVEQDDADAMLTGLTHQYPDAEALEEIARHTADLARQFNVEPRAAMLSYSNFGSVDNESTRKSQLAADRLRSDPAVDFEVDGEMQADTALVEDILEGSYEFSDLDGPANVLIFPNLESGNIGYKLLQRLGGADAIGPMLVGIDEPVHVLQRGDEVSDIVNLAGVAVVDAQQHGTADE